MERKAICLFAFTLLVGILLGGCTSSLVSPEETTRFSVTPIGSTGSFYRDDGFIIAVDSVYSQRTLLLSGENYWENPKISFKVLPVSNRTLSTEDKETIYFSVSGLDRKVGDSRLFNRVGDNYNVYWECGDETFYENGNKNVFYTRAETITLTFGINRVGLSASNVGYTTTIYTELRNVDGSWNATYPVDIILARRI